MMVTIDISDTGPFVSAWDHFDDYCVNQTHDWANGYIDSGRYVDRLVSGLKSHHATYNGVKQTIDFESEDDYTMFLLRWG